MEAKFKWVGKIAASLGLLGVMFAASGEALADAYNIILKGLPACATATGGFSFTKSVVTTAGGPASLTSPSTFFLQIVLIIPAKSSCMGVINNSNNQVSQTLTFSQPNPFNGVVVQNPFSTTGDSQGLSVVGLNITLDNGQNGSNNYTVQFSTSGIAGCPTSAGCGTYGAPTRSFSLFNNGLPSIFTGIYDARNVAATIPEPETLWLALVGLSVLALSRRKRRIN